MSLISNEPRVRGGADATADVAQRATEAERAGHWDAAAVLYAHTFRASLHDGQTERAADALRGQARMLLQQRRFDEAEELAELSVELAGRHQLRQAVARGLNVLGLIRFWHRGGEAAEGLYREALELAMELGDDELVGLACQNLGVVASVRGDFQEARRRYLEGIGSFVRSGSTANAMLAYNNLGMASVDLGEWMDAEVYFSRGIEIAERLGHVPSTGLLYSNLAEPLIHVGEFQRAQQALDRAEQAASAIGDHTTLAGVARSRGMIARMHGDLGAADAFLGRAMEITAGPQPDLDRAGVLRELGELRAAQGRRAEALESLREAERLFRALGAQADARAMQARMAAMEAEPARG
jgi:tetratricopeptide (TPR) repeat protein